MKQQPLSYRMGLVYFTLQTDIPCEITLIASAHWAHILWGHNNHECVEPGLLTHTFLPGTHNFTLAAEGLFGLGVSKCNLTHINFVNCNFLRIFDCSCNSLKDLDVRNLPDLKTLYCFANKLEHLAISPYSMIEHMSCDLNRLKEIDVNNCCNLRTLSCAYNQLEKINLKNCFKLLSIDCHHNNLQPRHLKTIVKDLPMRLCARNIIWCSIPEEKITDLITKLKYKNWHYKAILTSYKYAYTPEKKTNPRQVL